MTDAIELGGKRILVTGGSMGIGLAAAKACLEGGACVVICARGASDVEEAVGNLSADAPGRVAGIAADVSDIGQVDRALDKVRDDFGGLDGVIHSAGIYGPIGPVTDVDPDAWFGAIRINLFGSFLVARQAARRMKEAGGGRIALFSGGGAATPFPNYTGYACGKVGVVRLTETMAIELAPHNIAINCIAPGFVITRLHQQTLAAGPDAAGGKFFENTKAQFESGGVSADVGGRCAAFFMSDASQDISGRFVAAPYDDYRKWPERRAAFEGSDIFTLRRIIPRDRGGDWQ